MVRLTVHRFPRRLGRYLPLKGQKPLLRERHLSNRLPHLPQALRRRWEPRTRETPPQRQELGEETNRAFSLRRGYR